MANDANPVKGTVFKNSMAVNLARVVDVDDSNLVQSSVQSCTYTIYELDEHDENGETAVTGHDGASVTVSTSFFASLQTDSIWDKDSTGFNFKHAIDNSSNEAFPNRGKVYLVVYNIVTTSSDKIRLEFRLWCE